MIIADTGFSLALGDKNDKHHQQADNFAKTSRERLVSTYPVMTEVCHLLLKRQGIAAQLKFVTMYQLGVIFKLSAGKIPSLSLTCYAKTNRTSPHRHPSRRHFDLAV